MKETTSILTLSIISLIFGACLYTSPSGDQAAASLVVSTTVDGTLNTTETGGDSVASEPEVLTAAAPTFSLDAGIPYFSANSTDITTTESTGTIHYTTDGTDPDCSSTEFTGSIALAANTALELKAITCAPDMNNSAIVSATYVMAPVTHGTHDTPNNAQGIHVQNGYAYVADWGGTEFRIYDVSDPDAPGYSSGENHTGNPRNVFVSGDYAYVTMSSMGFRIYSLSNPANASHAFSFNPPSGNAYDLFVTNNTLYFANNDDIYIYDVTNPSSASQLGHFTSISSAQGIVVSGNHAYVGARGNGLQVLDVSNPASVSIVANVPTTDARDTFIAGDYAYVADGVGGLRIIDISTPTSPVEVGSYNTSMDSYGVHVVGDYAYVADGANGFKIINVSNPASPTLEATVSTGGVLARGIYVTDGYAYLANDTDGIRIYRVAPN